jgi:hypothetical protein
VVTVRLAGDDPQTLNAATIGGAWLAVAGRIMAHGVASRYDGWPIREISHVTLCVEHPDPDDAIIARFAEPERLAWMHANFTDRSRVAELGGADSYATRLFDYEHSGPPADDRQVGACVPDRVRVRAPGTGRSRPVTGDPYRVSTALVGWRMLGPGGAQSGAGSSPRSAALARRRASFSERPRACGGRR